MTKRYQERECLECGVVIRESAYSGNDGNFRKHVKSHEAANARADKAVAARSVERSKSRFAKGSGCYTCVSCKKRTRSTGRGDNEHLRLCERCYEIAGDENAVLDGQMTQAEFDRKWKTQSWKISDCHLTHDEQSMIVFALRCITEEGPYPDFDNFAYFTRDAIIDALKKLKSNLKPEHSALYESVVAKIAA